MYDDDDDDSDNGVGDDECDGSDSRDCDDNGEILWRAAMQRRKTMFRRLATMAGY